MALLEVKDLEVRFDTRDGELTAVNRISLTLDEGSTLGIVGESGSGKSQTVLAIMGLLASNGHCSGSARFRDTELLGMDAGELNKIRGGRTPNLDTLAKEGLSFTRFYAENVCTSSRMAFMTGRYAHRTGMELTKVTPPEGVGMNDREVRIASWSARSQHDRGCRRDLGPSDRSTRPSRTPILPSAIYEVAQ